MDRDAAMTMPAGTPAIDLDRLLSAMRPRLHRYCARMVGSVIDGVPGGAAPLGALQG